MNYEQAKKFHAENQGAEIYVARYEGRVWNAGRMVDVGEVISYHLTKEDAESACRNFELFDFDKEHCYTIVEPCDEHEFDS